MVDMGKEKNTQIWNMFRNDDKHDPVVDWLFGGGEKEGGVKEKEHSEMTFDFLDTELHGHLRKRGTKKQDPLFNCFIATSQI